MSRILFVTWDGGGNVPPAVGIARELTRRGHDVRFMGHPSQVKAFVDYGLPFTPFATASPFESADGASPGTIIRIFGDLAMGADVVAAVHSTAPDLVVVDCLMFGVMRALRDAQVPYTVVEHTFDGFQRRAARSPLGAILGLKGFPILRLTDGGQRTICASVSELDHGFGDVVHTGAVVHGRPAEPAEPTILLSMSTFGFKPLLNRWKAALAAVEGLPVKVIATTGPAVDTSRLNVPANVELHGWLAHEDVLPRVSAVLTHGGHATAMVSLAHNLPLVVVPVDPKTDQPFVAKTLEKAGVGIAPGRRPSAIRAAVERVLEDTTMRNAAARLGEQIRSNPGDVGGANELESLLAA